MRRTSILSQYSYCFTALGITVLVVVSFGFGMISEVRHVLWIETMGTIASVPPWLWITATTSVLITTVIWYRIAVGAIHYSLRRNSLVREITNWLSPLSEELIPPDILHTAHWHIIEDSKRYAFTWGILRQNIGISRGLWEALDSAGRRAVMYHESAHASARDPLQQTILQTLSLSFGPLGMTQLYNRYLVRREILADVRALDANGGNDVPLITALLTAVQSEPGLETQVGLTGAFEARVEFISTGRIPTWWDTALRLRFVPTLLAVSLTIGQGVLIWCH
ncbi:M48 family metalloprotease [Alicyclobacillus sp. SO9]|uniref:M48 family metalloprotease n=1 Tax=Alicyclobacillus sp. SO9 TaxID=2665646 RepID=UPI0018E8F0EB|nr:M48 family metalloprotease [Alicyclobacillus sp. SO9]QQE77644.1 M48 family metalloprotease [Alicyclobacillus sp. SO9]